MRPVTPGDRAELVALEADPEVMRFLNGGKPVPEEGVVDGDFLTPRGSEPEVMAARIGATGDFLGWFALFDDGWVDGMKTGELGYRLRREHWGQGYATEGVLAIVASAFESMGFDRLRAQTMTINQGSRRVLEKAGFRHMETHFPPSPTAVPGDDQSEALYEIQRRHQHPCAAITGWR